MYQHDVDQSLFKYTLDGVVEDVVNRVGVDVNTASPALLAYVAGIGPKLAEKVVAYRDEKGTFKDRNRLRDVAGLGPKAYEQCAGFTADAGWGKIRSMLQRSIRKATRLRIRSLKEWV